jgi:hypothetical protein
MIAEMVNMEKDAERQILHDQLNMRKICANGPEKPHSGTKRQPKKKKTIALTSWNEIIEQPDVLENVITCDETWIFQYDPETKRQSMHSKTHPSPRMQRARMIKSKVKAMMIVFFDIRGVIMIEWVPEGQTVNQITTWRS